MNRLVPNNRKLHSLGRIGANVKVPSTDDQIVRITYAYNPNMVYSLEECFTCICILDSPHECGRAISTSFKCTAIHRVRTQQKEKGEESSF